MYKLRKKVWSAVLSAAMILTCVPGGNVVAAAQNENEPPQLITDYEMTLTEDGKLKDQAGGHDAEMVSMGEADISNGALTFTGNKSQYVKLPEGAFGDDESFSIELKFNTSQQAYAWVYNLGANNINDYVFLNPMRAGGNTVFALRQNPDGEKYVDKSGVVMPGQDTWATMVFHDDKKAELYINGERVGTTQHGYSLQTILNNGKNGDCVGYLGKSLYELDPGYVGTISYFRVYDTSLSEEQVWSHYSSEYFSDKEKAEMDVEELANEIEEGDIIENLDLPSSGKNGALIRWTSSAPEVLSETGVITRAKNDQIVTLTASVTYGSDTASKSFQFTVISDGTIVKRAKEQLKIENAQPVIENLTLATEVEGAAITWKSSDTTIITDQAVPNKDYADTPAGVVTRGDKDENVTLTATITSGNESDTKVFDLTVKKKADTKEYAAYLYVHFNELIVGTSLQQIYFSVSKDGLQWTALNDNQPILYSTVGDEGVRDPYIIRSPEGDKFYLIGTDLDIHHERYGGDWGKMGSQGSNALVIWESADLINWSECRMVEVADSIGAGCAWAPAAVFDEVTGEYLVFWSSNLTRLGMDGKGYIFVSKTRDFVTFTEPELYSDPAIDTIDADIYKNDATGTYYRLLKQQAIGYVYLQSSDKLLNYTNPPVYHLGGREFVARGTHFERIPNDADASCLETYKGYGVYEGPTMFKFNDRDEWCILIDEYGHPQARGYIPFFTKNLDEPNSVKIAEDNTYTLTDGAKHGGVIPITQEEYDALMDKWGVQNEEYRKEQRKPILTYDFEEETQDGVIEDKAGDNDGQLFGNAEYRYDAERDSQVLYLDGTDGTYAQLPTGLLDGLDYMTVAMDIKAESTSEYHFDFAVGQDTNRYMFLRVRDNQIRNAITARGNTLEKAVQRSGQGFLNQWMHVTAVMDNHKMYLYLDGEKVAETSGVGVRSISELGENLIAYLGKSFYPDPYFKGSYDNVKIYNRALSDSEVRNEYSGEPEIEEFTATYLAGEGGSVEGKTVQTVEEGSATEEVTAVPQDGYVFSKWSDGVTTPIRSDVLTKDLSVTAEFEKKQAIDDKPGTDDKPGANDKPMPDEKPNTDEKPVPPTQQEAIKVTLNKSKITLGVKEKFALKASVSPAAASQKVTWKSSKKSVVSVSASGKITAKKTGKATITAITANGKKASCKVTVKKAPKTLTLNAKTKTLKKGKSFKIKVTLPNKTASYKKTFSSSKKSVATVSAAGKVTAKKKGKAVITVKTFNNKKAKLAIIVK